MQDMANSWTELDAPDDVLVSDGFVRWFRRLCMSDWLLNVSSFDAVMPITVIR